MGHDTLTPRLAATFILTNLLKKQGSLASLLPQYLPKLSPQDKGLAQEICYGCCRWYPILSSLLDSLLAKPLKKKDSDVKAILLVGIYQLQYMQVPEYAAINEAVKGASAIKKIWAKKLINGVLRSFQRNQVSLINQAEQQSPSVHPLWLEKHIQRAWPQQSADIFAANNQHPPMTLRVNQQVISRDEYLQRLAEEGIQAMSAKYSPCGVYLDQAVPVSALPLFEQGGVSVQDEAAQLAAELLDLNPGFNVLDACTAPGGKACHMREIQPSLGRLLALDIDDARLQKVSENLERLSLQADLVCGDGLTPEAWWDGEKFDRILLDAPCSATGVIRRQPDIKLLREPEQVAKAFALQLQLLKALWPLLKDGGILVYATCSILPEENAQVVAQFLHLQANAQHDPISAPWGISQDYGRQLFPSKAGHDGFYYARLRKKL